MRQCVRDVFISTTIYLLLLLLLNYKLLQPLSRQQSVWWWKDFGRRKKKKIGQYEVKLQHNLSWKNKRGSQTQVESLTLRKLIIWSFVVNGNCRLRPVHLGWDQVAEVAMTNGLCCSHTHPSQWPTEASLLTERAPIRPEILQRAMKDDYSELCCICSPSFSALWGALGSARKVLPHRFNVLWVPRLHKCFLILAIICFLKVSAPCFLLKHSGFSWRSAVEQQQVHLGGNRFLKCIRTF